MALSNNGRTPLTDEEIIRLYFERNENAISATDKKYGKYLITIAYNILRDKPDCEECLNDTYLGTWNSIPPKKPNVLRVFLAKIMRNVSLDKFRERHAARRVPSEMMSALEELRECTYYSPSVEEEYLVSELSRILNDYIVELSERRQFIFVCRYYYADNITRIGSMLGISESTVYRELSEIRSGLKELLIKEGYFNE